MGFLRPIQYRHSLAQQRPIMERLLAQLHRRVRLRRDDRPMTCHAVASSGDSAVHAGRRIACRGRRIARRYHPHRHGNQNKKNGRAHIDGAGRRVYRPTTMLPRPSLCRATLVASAKPSEVYFPACDKLNEVGRRYLLRD